jgi:tRNA(Ile)-lysidine synthase
VQVARFARDLDRLIPPLPGEEENPQDGRGNALGATLGVAVSGGPDSLALLLLAHAARPGTIAAATVDHGLRATARAEAEQVAAICAGLGVPHRILAARWTRPPTANVQARARHERYALLAEWATAEGLGAVATAHHADDQAETLLMRLARGSGLGGLGGARAARPLGADSRLIRPLLGWRKAELVAVVAAAGLTAVEDPANSDPRHDRARVRQWLAENPALDPLRLAASAAWLREADAALEWVSADLAARRLGHHADGIMIDPAGLPPELQRRLLLTAFAMLKAPSPAGPDLARALTALRAGRTVTLSGLKLTPGDDWHVGPAPPRARRC